MKKKIIIISSFIIAILTILSIVGVYFTKQSDLNIKDVAVESTPYDNDKVYYVAVEENEDSKLNSIRAKSMVQSTDSNTVTIQEGNIVVYVDTDLAINSSIANYRTIYGTGEKIVIKVYFDKVIKSVSSAKLYLKFGSGDERQATYKGISGSEIIFEYTIASGDTGELALTNLKGTVTDNDNNSIEIGLSQAKSIQYQSPGSIIADSTIPTYDVSVLKKGTNILETTITFSEKMYKVSDNKIKNITNSDLSSFIKLKIKYNDKYYNPKGDFSDYEIKEEDGKTVISFNYTWKEGDNGVPYITMEKIYDIAGNGITVKKLINTELDPSAWTPYVTNVTFSSEGNLIGNEGSSSYTRYLNEGKKIKAVVTYNEKVYEDENQTEMSTGANKIKFKIGDSEKNASVTKISEDGKTITYTYTVEDGDNGQFTNIRIPKNTVYDNAGHANEESDWIAIEPINGVTEFRVVDTTAPTATIKAVTEKGNYKANSVIEYKITFSELVNDGDVETYFSDSTDIKNNISILGFDNMEYETERTYERIIESKENGYLIVHLIGNGFEDYAGNKVAEKTKNLSSIYADTQGPTITISADEKTNDNIVTYTFTLEDNSDSYPSDITPRGLKEETFTLEDINTNGQIVSSKKDSNNNISTISVYTGTDGLQMVWVKSGAFQDALGNKNNKQVRKTVLVDTTVPVITNIDKSPSDWTNNDVTLTVYANDTGTDIKGYKFGDNEQSTINTFKVTENQTVTIKVTDNVGNSAIRDVIISNIDKVAPTLNLVSTKSGNNTIIDITAKDVDSGINYCEVDGLKIELDSNGKYSYTATENGTYVVTVVDKAGNMVTKTVTVNSKAPTITHIEKTPTEWTNQYVTLIVDAKDEGLGIKGYAFNGGAETTNNAYKVTENGTINIQVEDNAKNISTASVEITNIDKTQPTLNLSQDGNSEKSKITVSASDNDSGIANCEINGIKVTLSKNGKYEFISTKNGIFTVTVTDNAGNSTTETIEVTSIVEEVPEDAAIIYSKNGGTYILNKENKVIIEESVQVSNIAISKIEYAWTNNTNEPTKYVNGGNSTTLNIQEECVQEGNYYLHIRVTDRNNHITTSHSNAFVVEVQPIELDDSVVVETIQDTGYIILSKPTEASELLEKITSSKYTIKIKNEDLIKDSTGKLKTGDVVVIEELDNEIEYKICVKGDINADGNIDMKDIFALNKYRLGRLELNETTMLAGDVNNDKTINMNDVFQINKYRLGKIENF